MHQTIFSSRKSKCNHWFTSTLRAFKYTVRHAENIWNVPTLLVIDPLSKFKSLRNRYHNLILASKKQFYSNLVSSCLGNPRRLWQTINKLLHRKSSSPLPTSTSASPVADSLASFLTDKISKLRLSLANSSTSASPCSPSSPITPPDFCTFKPAFESKSLKSYWTAPTSNLTLIPSLLGFSENALHSWSLLSPT